MGALALTEAAGIVPPPDPFGDLAREAATGDLPAMRRLLDAVAPRVVAVVKGVLGGGSPDADDVAQESLIALVRALPAFRGECTIVGYASRIAVRTALASRRRHAAHQDKRHALENDGDTGASVPSVAQRAARAQRLTLLRGLLDELPASQGETFALRVVLGCSLGEIAEATGAPVNTVRSRLRLAREALRQRIESDPVLAEELEVYQ